MSVSKSSVIEKAKKFVSKGKYKLAIAEWKKLVAENPKDGNIYNAIGDLYLKTGDTSSSTAAFTQSAEAFREAAFELKSIALYKKVLKVDPSMVEVYEKLAAVYAERGLVGSAIDDYLKAAKHYFKKGDFRASLSVYRKISGLDPENVTICLQIAEMCQRQEFTEEAVEEFKKVISIYKMQNKTAEVEEIREKILAIDPSYTDEKETLIPDMPGEEPVSEAEEDVLDTSETFSAEEGLPEAEDLSFLEAEPEPMAEEKTIYQTDNPIIAEQGTKDDPSVHHEEPLEGSLAEKEQEAFLDELERLGPGMEETPVSEVQAGFPEEEEKVSLESDEAQSGEADEGFSFTEMEDDPFGEPIEDESSLSSDLDETTLGSSEPGLSSKASQVEAEGEGVVSSGLDEKPIDQQYIDLQAIISEDIDNDQNEHTLDRTIRSAQAEAKGCQKEKEAETQYDLGIAYKEMGMISEAIKAFEMASLGENRFEDAMVILSACIRETESNDAAIEILEKALFDRNSLPGELIALKYELALLYERRGDRKALSLYQEVYSSDPEFRNVSKKYKRLKANNLKASVVNLGQEEDIKKPIKAN